jgi:hypothetical protein
MGRGGISNNDKPKQNRMLENYFCNDRIRNDEVASILLSFDRKNKLDMLDISSHLGKRSYLPWE